MDHKKEKKFIKKPIYPGGNQAYIKFIKENLKYPKQALSDRVSGVVVIKYSIDYKGNVTKANVISSVGAGCDEEALRVVKLLKFEIPDTPRKLRISFNKTAKIKFSLPKKKKKEAIVAPKRTQIKYTITSSKQPEKSYSYQIKIG